MSLDKVVAITGASGGIGAALAEHLGGRGASLVLAARRAGALEEVASRCGSRVHPVVADVTSRAEVRRIVEEGVARFGRIDAWVNNVGRGITRAPSELDDDDIDEMIRINVKTALYGTQESLRHFKERGTGQVVTVSSMLGRVPGTTVRSAYTASKHFLNALVASFRTELQQSHPGIHVCLVSPGVVRTDFGDNALHGGPSSHQLADSQSAEEVAAVIAGVIESLRPDVYTRRGAKARVAAYFDSAGSDP